ncbi:hypothetical protein D9M72_592640 [compost metagenome]
MKRASRSRSAYVAKTGPIDNGVRREVAWVSGSRSAYQVARINPSTLTDPKVQRQPTNCSATLPSKGENPGAAAIATITIASTFESVSPSNRSLAMARASTDAAHTPAA